MFVSVSEVFIIYACMHARKPLRRRMSLRGAPSAPTQLELAKAAFEAMRAISVEVDAQTYTSEPDEVVRQAWAEHDNILDAMNETAKGSADYVLICRIERLARNIATGIESRLAPPPMDMDVDEFHLDDHLDDEEVNNAAFDANMCEGAAPPIITLTEFPETLYTPHGEFENAGGGASAASPPLKLQFYQCMHSILDPMIAIRANLASGERHTTYQKRTNIQNVLHQWNDNRWGKPDILLDWILPILPSKDIQAVKAFSSDPGVQAAYSRCVNRLLRYYGFELHVDEDKQPFLDDMIDSAMTSPIMKFKIQRRRRTDETMLHLTHLIESIKSVGNPDTKDRMVELIESEVFGAIERA